MINTEHANFISYLNTVPYNLNILEHHFILVGIIGFQNNKFNNNKHYVAYTKSITGGWQERNNIKKSLIVFKTFPIVNVALLVYIKSNV